ncbi:type 1 glutamine amidotransferase domain-containing protein [Kitasatospora sp. CM 4170]|uniref:Type 1 glutamine amidotransferase domain-containing protein n=1 Tax=Kitasatospora aburaviensis TaxID=67265 RepID=A0ABW1F9C7_9ACTN|nr:type 1 glutamine amidotransferase domain-containing protein [Kitasatospora sp. CM 4170]WNM49367.1 type 1 glutamine amidotransferase domain-containing protein [Kitasatospora sp. CM 4170]
MAPLLTLIGRSVAFLVAPKGAEQVELTTPWQAVAEAGGTPRLVSTRAGLVQAFKHLERADTFPVDDVVGDADPAHYDALVLPGGVANPDHLRMDGGAVGFVRALCEAGRPVAVICHGAWTLVEADVVRGRTLTSWPSIRTDLVNAGARWVDEEVHVCRDGPGVLVSSRKPADLPAFVDTFVTEFTHARASGVTPPWPTAHAPDPSRHAPGKGAGRAA